MTVETFTIVDFQMQQVHCQETTDYITITGFSWSTRQIRSIVKPQDESLTLNLCKDQLNENRSLKITLSERTKKN